MTSFDDIYLLDLHGNSNKKEKCPDGSEDKNVFDIRQGVVIGLFIKKKGLKKKVVYAERWGLREDKYEWLAKNDLNTTKWKPIKPKSDLYLFVPRDEATLDQYNQHPKVTEIFPLNGVGMTTARDEFVIDLDKGKLLNRIRLFKHSKQTDDELHTTFDINKKKGWSIRKAWNMLQDISDSELEQLIFPVLYRPFDVRWIFYHDSLVWRTVKKVMAHLLHDNLALIAPRRVELYGGWQHALVSSVPVEHVTLSLKTIDCVFPLYLYGDTDKKDLFSTTESHHKKPNLNPELLTALTKTYGKKPTPEEIFYYIYAVLYANTYRTRYAEFLKTDFPRVPFTKSHKLFSDMGKCGKQLVDLHLLKAPDLEHPVARFEGKGDNRLEKQRYDDKEQRVYINAVQYFEGIEKDVWDYQIGGYQVLDKWLKDRKDRMLSLDEIKHYCRIATALKKTVGIQAEIDGLFPTIEKEVLPLVLSQ